MSVSFAVNPIAPGIDADPGACPAKPQASNGWSLLTSARHVGEVLTELACVGLALAGFCWSALAAAAWSEGMRGVWSLEQSFAFLEQAGLGRGLFLGACLFGIALAMLLCVSSSPWGAPTRPWPARWAARAGALASPSLLAWACAAVAVASAQPDVGSIALAVGACAGWSACHGAYWRASLRRLRPDSQADEIKVFKFFNGLGVCCCVAALGICAWKGASPAPSASAQQAQELALGEAMSAGRQALGERSREETALAAQWLSSSSAQQMATRPERALP
jgi:hypothetical protein